MPVEAIRAFDKSCGAFAVGRGSAPMRFVLVEDFIDKDEWNEILLYLLVVVCLPLHSDRNPCHLPMGGQITLSTEAVHIDMEPSRRILIDGSGGLCAFRLPTRAAAWTRRPCSGLRAVFHRQTGRKGHGAMAGHRLRDRFPAQRVGFGSSP